eukprot:TRINITY_DN114879_c0_g1_i1.p1 TRINITY_DN114879_c0_g1~~TRINITY_DN114879_c0_g1_i1.p1  ORF type:complete len:426 (-),score=47.39 TRINITY_DN114879_c0_g1_i1:144-1367(-)
MQPMYQTYVTSSPHSITQYPQYPVTVVSAPHQYGTVRTVPQQPVNTGRTVRYHQVYAQTPVAPAQIIHKPTTKSAPIRSWTQPGAPSPSPVPQKQKNPTTTSWPSQASTASPGVLREAYSIAREVVNSGLSQAEKQTLANIDATDIVVIDGDHDHIHEVMDAMELPFTRVSRDDVSRLNFRPDQTVYVNCCGFFPEEGLHKLEKFVRAGGQLITTDWALLNVVQKAFPGTIYYNNKNPTADEVVSVQVAKGANDPVVEGLFQENVDPSWWLETTSYPISIHTGFKKKAKVDVLVRSAELGKRYQGRDAVIVKFAWGKGVVYHMISHFYLQRSETKHKKQAVQASAYLTEHYTGSAADGARLQTLVASSPISYGEMQSAKTSSEFVTKAVVHQKMRSPQTCPPAPTAR